MSLERACSGSGPECTSRINAVLHTLTACAALRLSALDQSACAQFVESWHVHGTTA